MEEMKNAPMMEPNNENVNANTVEKMPYEELERIAAALEQRCIDLYSKLQNAQYTEAYMRLEMLFNVLKYSGSFDMEFVKQCADEITTMLTIPPMPTDVEQKN